MVDKLKNHVSPRGLFKYPHLTKADTKFNPDGEYKVSLVWKNGEAKDFVNLLETEHKSSVELAKKKNQGKSIKTAKVPFKVNEETKEIEATFKLKAVGKSAKTGNTWSQKPAIFDAAGKPMEIKEIIYGGSEGKISYQIVPWYTPMLGAGITLRMKAVQILKLVTGNGGSSDSFGFAKETGYEHVEQQQEEVIQSTSDF